MQGSEKPCAMFIHLNYVLNFATVFITALFHRVDASQKYQCAAMLSLLLVTEMDRRRMFIYLADC